MGSAYNVAGSSQQAICGPRGAYHTMRASLASLSLRQPRGSIGLGFLIDFLILWQRRVERVAEAGPLKTSTHAVVRACVVA